MKDKIHLVIAIECCHQFYLGICTINEQYEINSEYDYILVLYNGACHPAKELNNSNILPGPFIASPSTSPTILQLTAA